MGISDNIILKEIDDKSAAQLTEILNTDVMLQDSLGSKKIWGKHGAKVELVDDKYHVSLVL